MPLHSISLLDQSDQSGQHIFFGNAELSVVDHDVHFQLRPVVEFRPVRPAAAAQVARRLGAQQHGRPQRDGAAGQAIKPAGQQLRIRDGRGDGSLHHEELQRRPGSEIFRRLPRRNSLHQRFPERRYFPQRYPGTCVMLFLIMHVINPFLFYVLLFPSLKSG